MSECVINSGPEAQLRDELVYGVAVPSPSTSSWLPSVLQTASGHAICTVKFFFWGEEIMGCQRGSSCWVMTARAYKMERSPAGLREGRRQETGRVGQLACWGSEEPTRSGTGSELRAH